MELNNVRWYNNLYHDWLYHHHILDNRDINLKYKNFPSYNGQYLILDNRNHFNLQQNAKTIAQIDCLLSFAILAVSHNYVRPVVDESTDIEELEKSKW